MLKLLSYEEFLYSRITILFFAILNKMSETTSPTEMDN